MSRLTSRWQRGNAILISLIIMAATLTISLGIAALVGSEVKTTGLLVPSERAYYKSESFVEQALWEKTKGASSPNYQVQNKGVLGNGGYVCTTAPCFQTDPRGTQDLLTRFSASTQPPNGQVTLEQDDSQQLDVGTSTAATPPRLEFSGLGAVTATGQNPTGNYAGLEVTIVAYPKSTASATSFVSTTTGQSTTTFIDKKLIKPNVASQTFNLAGTQNPLGETFPPLSTYNYRLRIKALGSDAQATVKATVPGGGGTQTELPLYAPDFTALAVTEDTKAQRGVQAVLPNVPEVLGIFDYVLFADLDLAKVSGKKPANANSQGITVNVYNDVNCNNVQEAGEGPVSGVGVGLTGGPTDPQSTDTSGTGSAAFTNLYTGTYNVSLGSLPSQYTNCGPNNQNVTVASGQNVSATLRVRTKRKILYQYFNGGTVSDHFYTLNFAELGFGQGGYALETDQGYLYEQSQPGTVPLYRLVIGAPYYDHFYTTNAFAVAILTQNGWGNEGIAGYIAPYTGPQGTAGGPNPYNNSCPAGTQPLYKSSNQGTPAIYFYDHYYTRTYVNGAFFYNYEGIEGCTWNGE
jgi:hypothetical protein